MGPSFTALLSEGSLSKGHCLIPTLIYPSAITFFHRPSKRTMTMGKTKTKLKPRMCL